MVADHVLSPPGDNSWKGIPTSRIRRGRGHVRGADTLHAEAVNGGRTYPSMFFRLTVSINWRILITVEVCR